MSVAGPAVGPSAFHDCPLHSIREYSFVRLKLSLDLPLLYPLFYKFDDTLPDHKGDGQKHHDGPSQVPVYQQ
ncbi:MAG TPA: hypothetical protein VIY49_03925 [Bryobacteraceae bacterium]